MIEFLRVQKVEVILSEFGTQAMRLAPLTSELGIPMITYFRGADATSELNKPGRVEAYKSLASNVRGFIAVAQCLLDNLDAHGISHPRSFVIPSGVDVRRFKPGEKIRNRCVAVGRMVEKKAPLTTIRAFCDVAQRDPSFTLEFIGGGPLLEACMRHVEERGMTHQVRLMGERTHDEVLGAMMRAEVFLQHSVKASDGNTEGLPTAIQEAMACGCAIVSTRHAGIPEAVEEGVNGFLVDEFDFEGYRNEIRKMLYREVDIGRMMASSRERAVARFDNEKLLVQTEHIIRKIVQENKAGKITGYIGRTDKAR